MKDVQIVMAADMCEWLVVSSIPEMLYSFSEVLVPGLLAIEEDEQVAVFLG